MRVLRMGVLVLMVLFLVVGVSHTQTVKEYCDNGIEYGAQGKFEEAEREFKKALETNQFHYPAKLGLKLIGDALEKKVENEVVIHLFKGVACHSKRMFDEAITECKKAIAINPNYDKAHSSLGLAYHSKGMFDEAITECKKAIAINPNDDYAHYTLAVVYYYGKGQYGLAIEHCDRAIELGCRVSPEFLEVLKPYQK